MIHEAIRALAAAWEHDTIGVNVRLDDLTRDDTDKRPPAIKKVLTPLDKEGEGIKIDPPDFGSDYPVLAVFQTGPWISLQGSKTVPFRDGEASLTTVYVTGERDIYEALLNGYQTVRAMLQTLTLWMRDENAALRQRNSVEVVGFSEEEGAIQIGEVLEIAGSALVTLHVTTALQIKDRQTIS